MSGPARPILTLHEGGGDLVGYLEDLLERTRKGEFTALAVASVSAEDVLGIGVVYRPDLHLPFAQILAAVDCLHHDLLEGGL